MVAFAGCERRECADSTMNFKIQILWSAGSLLPSGFFKLDGVSLDGELFGKYKAGSELVKVMVGAESRERLSRGYQTCRGWCIFENQLGLSDDLEITTNTNTGTAARNPSSHY